MRKSRTLSLLELHLTSGIDVMTSMPVVSELLKELIPSFSLSMIRVDERCAPREHYSEYFDEASHDLFASAGASIASNTDDPAAFGNLLKNKNPIGTLVDGRPDYIAGATYQHLFKRNGIHHCLDLALRDGTGPIGILGIFREEGTRAFTRGDIVVAKSIYEHLVHACAQRGAGSLVDEVETGLVVADKHGRIVWMSAGARAWLEDAAIAEDRAPLLQAARLPEACASLVRSLAHRRARPLSRPRDDNQLPPTVTLPVAGGRLRLRAYPLHDHAGASSAHVGIQLALEMDRTTRVIRALERTTLSRQQCRIAFAMWQRRSNAEIREQIGVSAATLKSYQKDLYARLAVEGGHEVGRILDVQARAVSLDLLRHQPRRGSLPPSPSSGSEA